MSEPLPMWLVSHLDDQDKYTVLSRECGEFRGYRYLRVQLIDHELIQLLEDQGNPQHNLECIVYVFAPWSDSLEDLIEISDTTRPHHGGTSPDERIRDSFLCRISQPFERGHYWKHLPKGRVPTA